MTVALAELPNPNALWATLLVEELYRTGLRDFVVAPGSRSTPLVAAAAQHGRVRMHLCRDERGAAFFALGLARGSGRAAAVITTSGTAVANLGPAVVEAAADGVPLLLLTADRPPELHDCGANQTVAQVGLFGAHVRWAFDMPCPDDRVPARFVLTTAAEAMLHVRHGPVHLNCRFREPLAPNAEPWHRDCLEGLDAWARQTAPLTRIQRVDSVMVDDALLEALSNAARPLLVLGTTQRCFDAIVSSGIAELTSELGWPVVADVRSGLRLGYDRPQHLPHVEHCLALHDCDVVVQLGARLVSKSLGESLGRTANPFAIVDELPHRADPTHRATHQVVGPIVPWLGEVVARLPAHRRRAPPLPSVWAAVNGSIERALATAIDGSAMLSEPSVARWLTSRIPADSGLFLSSSMPIRDVQRFGVRDGARVAVGANRGASGIDGVLATAIGFAVGLERPTTLLIGDQALLHDLNSLALLHDESPPLLVVVLNNGGGGIFSLLPISAHPELLTPWFDARHQFGFGGAAADFGIAHQAVGDLQSLAAACIRAWGSGAPAIVEVRCSLDANRAEQQRLQRVIASAVAASR